MERFKFYTIFFAVNLIIVIIFNLLDVSGFADLISFVSFLFSIVYFLFSFEEPPKAKKLLIPEVHSYYKSRMNTYSNLVALEFGVLAFLFFLLIASIGLSLSWIVILLWFLSIPVTFLIILITSRSAAKEKFVNYLELKFPDYESTLLTKIAESLIKSSSLELGDLLKMLKKDFPDNQNLPFENFVDTYLDYIEAEAAKLIKDEIKEINDL